MEKSYVAVEQMWLLKVYRMNAGSTRIGDDTTGGATAERKFLARVHCVSAFGDSQSLERLATCYQNMLIVILYLAGTGEGALPQLFLRAVLILWTKINENVKFYKAGRTRCYCAGSQ